MNLGKSFRWTSLAVVAILFFFAISQNNCAYAGGGGSLGGAKEITQLANKAQLIKQVEQAVRQTTTQLQQYQNMLFNTAKLPASVWKNATKELNKLRNLLKSAESLTFGLSFDSEKFDTRYPGYRKISDIDYPAYYKTRVADWQRYYRAALEANHIEAKRILDEQLFLESLNTASANAEGQVQMLQAANQIAVYMAQQITQLRLDMQRQIESQATFMLNQQQSDTDERAAWEEAIGEWKTPAPGKSF